MYLSFTWRTDAEATYQSYPFRLECGLLDKPYKPRRGAACRVPGEVEDFLAQLRLDAKHMPVLLPKSWWTDEYGDGGKTLSALMWPLVSTGRWSGPFVQHATLANVSAEMEAEVGSGSPGPVPVALVDIECDTSGGTRRLPECVKERLPSWPRLTWTRSGPRTATLAREG